ncbi:hypothetical protein ACFX2A_015408 [Malus domestica]
MLICFPMRSQARRSTGILAKRLSFSGRQWWSMSCQSKASSETAWPYAMSTPNSWTRQGLRRGVDCFGTPSV